MHATSAVAAAVVALNVAGVMAIPLKPVAHSSLALEGRSGSATTTTSATPASGHQAGGAVTTTTITFDPRPTACKPGETVTWVHKHKSAAGAEHNGAKHDKNSQHDTAKPAAVVARSDTPAPTGSSTKPSAVGAPAPTDPVAHDKTKGGKKAHKEHYATHTGTDGKTTVTHFVRGTSTKCFSPTETPGGKGTNKSHHKESSTGATHKDDSTTAAGKPAAAAKVAARSVGASEPATTTTAAPAAGNHAAGAVPTVTSTFTPRPRPTPCKDGEPVTYERKHKDKSSSASAKHDHAHPDLNAAKPAAVVARSATPTVTGTATSSSVAGAPAPTDLPDHGKKTKGEKKAQKDHFATHTGTDGKTTVTHYVKATTSITTTQCYAPTSTPGTANKSSHPASSAGATHKHDGAHSNDAGKSDKTSSVVARAVDLLERYFSELDELD
ncbi:hypothetical protein H0H87_010918 [Tephrocybe sp. NHM501043]|nr:hypothetical protein H0H87_010918 [Tephrocybe sp. NHM501043]